MIDGKLTTTHNYIDLEHYTVSSDKTVSAGKHKLKMEFDYEGGKDMGEGVTVTLSVDGKKVGSGKIDQTTPFKYSLSETQDIGRDNGTPVVYTYQTPLCSRARSRRWLWSWANKRM